MDVINNYIDSFLFHYNDSIAVVCKMLGLEFHYINGWGFLSICVLTLIMMYFIGRSNIFEWIYKYDRDMNYAALFVFIISFGLLYLFGGEQALVLLLFLGILIYSFYFIVLRNKRYAWLQELLMKLF